MFLTDRGYPRRSNVRTDTERDGDDSRRGKLDRASHPLPCTAVSEGTLIPWFLATYAKMTIRHADPTESSLALQTFQAPLVEKENCIGVSEAIGKVSSRLRWNLRFITPPGPVPTSVLQSPSPSSSLPLTLWCLRYATELPHRVSSNPSITAPFALRLSHVSTVVVMIVWRLRSVTSC